MDAGVPHRVVVVGGGFGGLNAARGLRRAPVEVTVLDRHNYHCFQPLLYQVATAGLSPGEISPPLRWVLRRQANARALMVRVTGFDVAAREVVGTGVDGHELRVPYDTLVLAAGARHGYFGHDEWEAHAPGLKTVDDALEIRRRILAAFERAELATDERERARLLTFAVVGAGPTGVELAGQIEEMAQRTLRDEYRAFDPATTRTLLFDAGDRPLAGFAATSSRACARSLAELGVELRTHCAVTAVDADGIVVSGDGVQGEEERVSAGTVLWAAGVQPSPLARALAAQVGASLDRAGRVHVQHDCSVAGHPELFVVGDIAATGLPGVAPAATQQGKYVATVIAARLAGRAAPKPFRYRDKGNMATIGRTHAVAEVGRLKVRGLAAWLLWLTVHLLYLVGFANRVLVLVRWLSAYVASGRGERVITSMRDRDA